MGLFASRKETLDKRRPPFSEQAANVWADRVAEFEFDLGELAMQHEALDRMARPENRALAMRGQPDECLHCRSIHGLYAGSFACLPPG